MSTRTMGLTKKAESADRPAFRAVFADQKHGRSKNGLKTPPASFTLSYAAVRRWGADLNREKVARGAGVLILVAAVLTTLLFHGLTYARYGVLSTLEASFPHAAAQALRGLVPYRDFAFIEMPLTLYLKGLCGSVIGHGLLSGRYVNLATTLVAIAGLVLVLRARLSRWEPGLAAVFAVTCSPHWVSAMIQGTTAPFTMFFLVLCFGATVVGSRDSDHPTGSTVLFTLGAVAAAMCSVQALPFIVGLAMVRLISLRGIGPRLVSAGALVFALALACGVCYWVAGDKFLFFNWTFMRESELSRHVMLLIAETWKISPGAILAFLTGMVAVSYLLKNKLFKELALLVLSFAAMVALLLPSNAYGKDVAPVVPFLAASGILTVWKAGPGLMSSFRLVFWVFPLISVLYPFPDLSPQETELEIVKTVEVLNEVASDGPILTPLAVIALLADGELYPGTDLGMFSVLSSKYRRYADELNMTTLKKLTSAVREKRLSAIVRIRGAAHGNFGWSVPDMQPQPRSQVRDFEIAVYQNYLGIHQSQTLEIFIRK